MVYMDILFFAVLAVFLAFRLRDVLGKEVEVKKKDIFPAAPALKTPVLQTKIENLDNTISPMAIKNLAPLRKEIKFNIKTFVPAVQSAYETIVKAFSEGDSETLRFLLAEDIFKGFEKALKERDKNTPFEKVTTVLIRSTQILDIDIEPHRVYLTLRFEAEHIKEVNGSEDVQRHQDIWTFVKEKTRKDNHWDLYATQSENKG
ncbi:MAG: Tim44/TimA family putative adaptor protein [Alphaproteobacteria bacterium]